MIKFKKFDSGRSMIEMLAVLAIIGVLSIGGLYAYTMAMNKKRSNDLITDANMIIATIVTNTDLTTVDDWDNLPFDEYADRQISRYHFYAQKEEGTLMFAAAQGVEHGVCVATVNMNHRNFAVKVVRDGHEVNACGDDNHNEVRFYLDPGLNGAVICGNNICVGNHYCADPATGECRCPDTFVDIGGRCQCPAGYVECDGSCVNNPCGNNPDIAAICRDGQITCECQKGNGYLPGLDANGNCACPAGFVDVGDGNCRTRTCEGGTPGANDWTCELDGERCGDGCTQDGLNCRRGMCDAGQCDGLPLVYHQGNRYFGCQNRSNRAICYWSGEHNYCYLPGERTACCRGKLDAQNCGYGMCDGTQCPAGTQFGRLNSAHEGTRWGCVHTTAGGDQIGCTNDKSAMSGGDIACDKNSIHCAGGKCQDYLGNGCCEESLACPPGTESFLPSGQHIQYCQRADGVYCRASGTCYKEGKSCGMKCDLDGNNCKGGTCNPNDCPNGTQWRQSFITGVAYAGCYNGTTDVWCLKNTGGKIACYKGGARCGTDCGSYNDSKGCCEKEGISCPNGTTRTVRKGIPACYNPNNNVTCIETGACYFGANEVQCGTKCQLDGTGCRSGVCDQSACPHGQVLEMKLGKYACVDAELSCQNGDCTIAESPCGKGCNEDGSDCSSGVCDQNECGVTTFRKLDFTKYGCTHDGLSCYHDNGTVSCVRNAGEYPCATGCNNMATIDGEHCQHYNCDGEN